MVTGLFRAEGLGEGKEPAHRDAQDTAEAKPGQPGALHQQFPSHYFCPASRSPDVSAPDAQLQGARTGGQMAPGNPTGFELQT